MTTARDDAVTAAELAGAAAAILAREQPAGARVAHAGSALRDALARAGLTPVPLPEAAALAEALAALDDVGVTALALTADELAHPPGPEPLLDAAARALPPGGHITATVANRRYAELRGAPAPAHAVDSDDVARVFGQRGLAVERALAPGAAARLGGHAPRVDLDADAAPGLADTVPRLLVLARTPRVFAEREQVFFDTLPRRVVAAAVLCRDRRGRLLVAHDAFKGVWTLPGGVVEAGELPSEAAARETREETGIGVAIGAPLGLFAAREPDRLIVVYDAQPLDDPPPSPEPVHAFESDDAAWVPLSEARARLSPSARFRVERCLDSPGTTRWLDEEIP